MQNNHASKNTNTDGNNKSNYNKYHNENDDRNANNLEERSTPHFCYRIVVFNKPGVFIIVSVPICIYKNVTKYLKIICMGDFFIFTHFLMGRWWLLCTALCSSKLRFGYR